MARIDVIDVGETLAEPARRGGGGESTFQIQNLGLRIADGQTMVVLGPSGCGKTTLLKIIAGLIPPDSGEVATTAWTFHEVSPGDRRIGMVFRATRSMRTSSSRTNVLSYFLFRKKTPALDALAQAKYQRTGELMGMELAYLLDRKPTTLSGGEKQRVALGRCITRDAAIFLVDEPFADLDQALRETLPGESQDPAAAVQHHHRVRDPRPPRGADPGRRDRGDGPRPHRAGRHAAAITRRRRTSSWPAS